MNHRGESDKREISLGEISTSLLETLFILAEDRADELKEEIETRGIRLVASEEQHESPMIAIPQTNEIRIHMPVLKRQLIMAYAYVLAYKASSAVLTQGALGQMMMVPSEGVMAVEMLRWAMMERVRVAAALQQHTEPPNEKVPEWWYFPDSNTQNGKTAIRLFHIALSADLHHELANLFRRHSSEHSDSALVQEWEADHDAATRILNGCSQEHAQFKARILGLLLSQLYEVFLVREGFRSDDKHPPLIERLKAAVIPHVSDPDHAAWTFIWTSLSLHLELANKRHEDDLLVTRPTHRDSAEHLMTFFES